jgi:hypothetical protein
MHISSAGILAFALIGCTSDKDTETPTDDNGIPVASAGPDLEVSANEPIIIDASGSYDPDGDALTYHWSFNRVPAESALMESGTFPGNNTAATSTELRPDVPGTYIVDLQVEDARGAESPVDSVVISVAPGDDPIANAGGNQDALTGQVVSLDGSSSYDPLGRSLTYEWSLASAPTNSSLSLIENPTQAITGLTPDVGGRFAVSLVVDNGMSESAPNIAYIDVRSDDPQVAVADAGADVEDAMDCSSVALDGSSSFDPNGDILTYEWTLQSKPAGSTASNADITNRNAEMTTFYPDIAGNYMVSLAVKDNDGWSAPDTMSFSASERNYNTAPDVEAGASQSIDGGTAVCEEQGYTYDCDSCSAVNVNLGLDALVSDADGDQFSLTWSVTGDAQASILAPGDLSTTAQVAGAAPLEPGSCSDTEYIFQLEAQDCPGGVGSDLVSVIVTCCGVTPPDSGR